MVKNIVCNRHFKIIPILLLSFLSIGFFVDQANSDENSANENYAHKGANCSNCHSFNKQTNVQKKTCLSCHLSIQEDNFLDLLDFHDDPDRQCTDCHSFHDTKILHSDSMKFQFDFKSESSKSTCYACHSIDGSLENLSEGHRDARKIYHTDLVAKSNLSLSQSCMACHGTNFNETGHSNNKSSMPFINNHASHPYEIEIVRGKGNSSNRIKFEIDPEIKLFNNRIECQTCHTLTSKNDNLLVNSENPYDLCSGCHEHNGNSIDLAGTQ